jgi:CheY-like chemotaxis protein
VRDTGVGMASDVLEHALEPFFTTKAAGEGTGLGLSVVHGIITGHGGVMSIVSTPGKGTTVTIDLPAGDEVPGLAGEAATGDSGRPVLRILFVEDEPQLASMQRRQLEHLGYRVTVHTASLDALEDFRSRPNAFDLVITDDTMPRMTGTALAAEIQRVRPAMPVLMVSGGDRIDPSKPRPAGVRQVLLKPHTLNELDRAIREVMSTPAADA